MCRSLAVDCDRSCAEYVTKLVLIEATYETVTVNQVCKFWGFKNRKASPLLPNIY